MENIGKIAAALSGGEPCYHRLLFLASCVSDDTTDLFSKAKSLEGQVERKRFRSATESSVRNQMLALNHPIAATSRVPIDRVDRSQLAFADTSRTLSLANRPPL